jgi:hypothetical protein
VRADSASLGISTRRNIGKVQRQHLTDFMPVQSFCHQKLLELHDIRVDGNCSRSVASMWVHRSVMA